ncbi:MAG: TRAP transporter substrate-binding protein [Bacteroidia bacterium]|nr:TRAP transporter substrate-binding protein [Bacteroidia bacterium]NNK89856.1 TRAP transporter substrate-binding protein [Saprospiraceae bacterium]
MEKLSRKRFFQGLAAGTLSLPFVIKALSSDSYAQKNDPAGYVSREKFKLKMVTTWPPNFPVLGEACNKFAEWVYKMSAGRLEIKVYGGGELVPALECFDAVKDGAADLGNGVSYYWAGKIKATQFFGAVPFGMNAQQRNAWILSGGGAQLWEELYEPYNLVPFISGNTGCQMGGWFNKEINTIDDLKGLKMRMPGLGGKVLEKAGGAPVLLAGGEIYTGLERGVIDATEWVGPYHDYLMGFYQIADYYYVNGWHETEAAVETIMNKEKWESLPGDLQEIIRSGLLRANMWVLSEFDAKNSIYLKKLVEEENVDLRYFSEDVLDALRGYTKEAIDEIIFNDPIAKKIYDSYKSFQDEISEWSSISERQYYTRIMS